MSQQLAITSTESMRCIRSLFKSLRPPLLTSGLLFAWVASAPATSTPPECALTLPPTIEQGHLVRGQLSPGCTVALGERALRVSDDGWFAFGVDRDAPAEIELRIRSPLGSEAKKTLPIAARRYPISRIDGIAPQMVEPPPQLARRIARERAALAQSRQTDDPRSDFAAPFIWPARGRISGVYGSQRIFNGVPKSPHLGLDIAAPTGTPLVAPAAGIIAFTQPDQYLNGGVVIIDHGHGVSSTFIHMSRIDVRAGQRVKQGDPVGAIGATGRTTGPHLHWGLNWFERQLDPWPLLPPPKRN